MKVISLLHRIMFILPCGKDYFGIFSEHIFFQSPPPSYCYWLIKANAGKMGAKINVRDTCLHRFVFFYDIVQILCKFFAMYPTQNQLVPWSFRSNCISLVFLLGSGLGRAFTGTFSSCISLSTTLKNSCRGVSSSAPIHLNLRICKTSSSSSKPSNLDC